jgi:L-histidine N-alpha-methyltransferase
MKIINLIKDNNRLKYEFAKDIIKGLTSKKKFISSQYFYDDKGSNLFQKITNSNDYYLTRCEFSILENAGHEIAELVQGDENKAIDVIELGVGDGHKSKLIINALLNSGMKIQYYPIDISEQALVLLKENLSSAQLVDIQGLVADNIDGISYVKNKSTFPKLLLFLGSSIGNFNPEKARDFLRELKSNLNPGDYVLIGFDQKKSVNILQKAYNDTEGITREFNLNILARINREMGANFIIDNFDHHGFYNPNIGAMESHLISLCDQAVNIGVLERPILFHKFEPLHLEYSYKYLLPEIEFMSSEAGFKIVKNFIDENNYFISSLWQVSGSRNKP